MLDSCLQSYHSISNSVRPQASPWAGSQFGPVTEPPFSRALLHFCPSDRNNSGSELLTVGWQPYLYVFWWWCFYVCAPHAGYSLRGPRVHQIFPNCSYKQFAALWVLGIEFWSLERTIGYLLSPKATFWIISLVQSVTKPCIPIALVTIPCFHLEYLYYLFFLEN